MRGAGSFNEAYALLTVSTSFSDDVLPTADRRRTSSRLTYRRPPTRIYSSRLRRTGVAVALPCACGDGEVPLARSESHHLTSQMYDRAVSRLLLRALRLNRDAISTVSHLRRAGPASLSRYSETRVLNLINPCCTRHSPSTPSLRHHSPSLAFRGSKI